MDNLFSPYSISTNIDYLPTTEAISILGFVNFEDLVGTLPPKPSTNIGSIIQINRGRKFQMFFSSGGILYIRFAEGDGWRPWRQI